MLDRDDRQTSGADLREADARFRQWMYENLSHAADHFGLAVAEPARLGWLDRSIGAPVRAGDRQLWLRVVSEDKQWTGGYFWTGNLDANVFAQLAKPRVLDEALRSAESPHDAAPTLSNADQS
ncbi:hypothetical protein ABZ345_46925 [Lentzea sp. NPDC005914]|uniref:hypothetical protein n=1 Tax=Lentzea sp. NPDC005914 TaxID=3154572 RepID=UPI0033C6760F